MKVGTKVMLLGVFFSLFAIPHLFFVLNNQVHIDCGEDYNMTCRTAKSLADVGNFTWILDLAIISLIPAGIFRNIKEVNEKNKAKVKNELG